MSTTTKHSMSSCSRNKSLFPSLRISMILNFRTRRFFKNFKTISLEKVLVKVHHQFPKQQHLFHHLSCPSCPIYSIPMLQFRLIHQHHGMSLRISLKTERLQTKSQRWADSWTLHWTFQSQDQQKRLTTSHRRRWCRTMVTTTRVRIIRRNILLQVRKWCLVVHQDFLTTCHSTMKKLISLLHAVFGP